MTHPLATSGQGRIDTLMEQASLALVKRRYFEVERLAAEALAAAIMADDFERAARICMPLQEARRLKRQLAIESGNITVITEPLPESFTLKPGCYILCPPRVGAEAKALRQAADEAEVPVIVIAREPTTQGGLCPIVAVGPITLRAMVDEPAGSLSKGKARKPSKSVPLPSAPRLFGPYPTPSIEWILAASEALGDTAIAQSATPIAADRADDLHARLQSWPDHEKLHQRLMEACEEASRQPKPTKPIPRRLADDEDDAMDD